LAGSLPGDCGWFVLPDYLNLGGTLWVSGPYNFTVEATDSGTPAQVVTLPFNGTIAKLLSCTPTTGPVEVDVLYSATCSAAFGTPPFTWSLFFGSLPSGLVLTGNGNTATITGTPMAPGSYNYSVEVVDSTPANANYDLQSFGGNIAPATGALNPSPAMLSFANQLVGTASSAQTITATNTSLVPVTVSDVRATGEFSQTNTCELGPIGPGNSCSVSVTFTPTSGRNLTGTIVFTDDVSNSPQLVTLNGIGLSGPLSLSTLSVSFPGQDIGTTSSGVLVTATNNGQEPINISDVTATGEFTQTNQCKAATLIPSASCTINIAFAPIAQGNRTGEVVITHDAQGSPQVVALNGVGLGSLSLSPLMLTFSGQAVNTTSTPQQITVTNNSSGPVTVSNVASTGDFAETNTCQSMAVGAGGSVQSA
jgi:hypothetical protein